VTQAGCVIVLGDAASEGIVSSYWKRRARKATVSPDTVEKRTGKDGIPCPRCGEPTVIRQHHVITDKMLRQPFYYLRWYRCVNLVSLRKRRLSHHRNYARGRPPLRECAGGRDRGPTGAARRHPRAADAAVILNLQPSCKSNLSCQTAHVSGSVSTIRRAQAKLRT
jgi:hypothetical protein